MAYQKDKQLIYQIVKKYLDNLKKNNIPVWRLYLYGSYAKIRITKTVTLTLLCSGIRMTSTALMRMSSY